jgi:hypothetical protein
MRMSQAQRNYIAAKARHEATKEIDRTCKTKVLAENDFRAEETGERITSPNSDFLMSEADFEKYCVLCFEEYKKHGLYLPDWNTTADYLSFPALMQAEKELIDWGLSNLQRAPEWASIAADVEQLRKALSYRLDIRKKVIDLTLKLAV